MIIGWLMGYFGSGDLVLKCGWKINSCIQNKHRKNTKNHKTQHNINYEYLQYIK